MRVLPPYGIQWEIEDPLRHQIALASYRGLADHMLQTCLYHTDKFNKKYRKEFAHLKSNRDYRLNCDDGDGVFKDLGSS